MPDSERGCCKLVLKTGTQRLPNHTKKQCENKAIAKNAISHSWKPGDC